jgi:hypothetical protein
MLERLMESGCSEINRMLEQVDGEHEKWHREEKAKGDTNELIKNGTRI